MKRRKPTTTKTTKTKRSRRSQPAAEVVVERTRVITEPVVEIRKPATLAQALTEPETAVVKPQTKMRVVRKTVRRPA